MKGNGNGTAVLEQPNAPVAQKSRVHMEVRAGDLEPYPDVNPRRIFDAAKHAEMVESLRENGIIQPVIVHRRTAEDVAANGGKPYWHIAGERRCRAAIAIGPDFPVPAMVGEYTREEALVIAMIENIDRDDLTATEEARGFDALVKEGWSQDRIAERFDRSQEHVSNRIRLLQLPEPIIELIDEGLLASSHARDYLLPFVNIPAKKRKQLYDAVIKDARSTAKAHPGAQLRGQEVEQVVSRTARALSKPVGTKDGVTPLFDQKVHAAGCTCQAPKFKYMSYGAATNRCFDEAWWEKTQSAARRKKAKEREVEKRSEKSVSKASKGKAAAAAGAMKYDEFVRKHGYNNRPIGDELLDASKLDGATCVAVKGYAGKDTSVFCTDRSKYNAAVAIVQEEREKLTASIRQDRNERDLAATKDLPITPAMVAAYMRADLSLEDEVFEEFGIEVNFQTREKSLKAIPDEKYAEMFKILAVRAQRGAYADRRTRFGGYGDPEVEKQLEEKYKPGMTALRKRVLAGEPKTEQPSVVAKKGAPVKRKTAKPEFMQPLQPDPVLAAVVGDKPMPRTEVTKKIWEYIKKNGLQDKKERRLINSDEKLAALFGGKKQVSMFEMTKFVNGHVGPAAAAAPKPKKGKLVQKDLEEEIAEEAAFV